MIIKPDIVTESNSAISEIARLWAKGGHAEITFIDPFTMRADFKEDLHIYRVEIFETTLTGKLRCNLWYDKYRCCFITENNLDVFIDHYNYLHEDFIIKARQLIEKIRQPTGSV